jgi:capsular polysaccharide transport system permease protein
MKYISNMLQTSERPLTVILNWIRRHRWFVLIVVAPTLISTIYYAIFASDVYISHSSFTIKSAGQKGGQVSTLANFIQTTSLAPGRDQTGEVIDFIRSRAALAGLEKRLDMRAIYGSHTGDVLSRFPGPLQDSTTERLFRYYNTMVGVSISEESGVTELQTKAFSAKDAAAIDAALLDLSEELVNRLNDRAQQQAIAEGLKRVAVSEQRLRNARLALGAYRNQAELIDPGKQASGVLEVSNQLVTAKAAVDAQLDLTRRVAPANPAIPALESRSRALGEQIAGQQGRAVGTGNGIAAKLGNYEKLALEQEFATQELSAANNAVEQARNDAARQQFYLERVVSPNVPDEAELPHRVARIATIAAALIFAYLIGWMFIVGILEHAPED